MVYTKFILIYLALASITILVSKYLEFFDKPNVRKIHSTPTINTGGLIIYFFFFIVIYLGEFNQNIEKIITIGFFVCFVGFLDDRINLSPVTKIFLIITPSIYLIFNGIFINNIGEYEYIGKIYLGKFAMPFLILALGLLINATNYIDGVDGLLLTFFLSCLIYYTFLIVDTQTILLIKIILIPVIFNLILNFLPRKTNLKIFNGDTGSLFIGFFISFMTIELYRGFNIHPAFLIWPLWYPIYDFLFVGINRYIKKKSLFSPDNSHLHHYILHKVNNSHIITAKVFLSLNSTLIFFGYLISNNSKLLSLIFFAVGFFIYLTIRINLDKSKIDL
jgi:UDP-GlcNAc:undecaprenyl-phosphate GlcNAc-1-phosphate transferase